MTKSSSVITQLSESAPVYCVCSFSRVKLFVTTWTVARQAPPSTAFPGKNTGVGCHFLLQGIFPTQESNPCLLCLIDKSLLFCCATWEVYSSSKDTHQSNRRSQEASIYRSAFISSGPKSQEISH